jgi:hypothetical protein
MNSHSIRGLRCAIAAGTLALGAGLVTAPGSAGGSVRAASSARLSLAGCAQGAIPTDFQTDAAHSGTLTPAKYSASGDMQASLIYDQFKHGTRNVFTNLTPSSNVGENLVIECVAMQFASSEDANRFFQSYKYQRSLAKGVAQKVAVPKHLGGASVGYKEKQQSFAGYNITSTNVVEMADQQGNYFFSVSIAGPVPQPSTAFALLKRIAVPA